MVAKKAYKIYELTGSEKKYFCSGGWDILLKSFETAAKKTTGSLMELKLDLLHFGPIGY